MTSALEACGDLSGRHSITLDNATWEPMVLAGQRLDGVSTHVLTSAPEGWTSYWMKMAPGSASIMHRHTAVEMLMVLRGSLQDSDGSLFRASEVIIYPAGSTHRLFSPQGCVLLVVEGRSSTAI